MSFNFHADHIGCIFYVHESGLSAGAEIQLDCHYLEEGKKPYKELPKTFHSSGVARLFAELLVGQPLHWEAHPILISHARQN